MAKYKRILLKLSGESLMGEVVSSFLLIFLLAKIIKANKSVWTYCR